MAQVPSNFFKQPYDSRLQSFKAETVARNIMVILARTGDVWRPLTWDEYMEHRLRDGSFTTSEKAIFDKVAPYCVSAERALQFCPSWLS